MGVQIGTTSVEGNSRISIKIKIYIQCDSEIPFLGIYQVNVLEYSQKMYVQDYCRIVCLQKEKNKETT